MMFKRKRISHISWNSFSLSHHLQLSPETGKLGRWMWRKLLFFHILDGTAFDIFPLAVFLLLLAGKKWLQHLWVTTVFIFPLFFRHMCSPFDMILLARYCCFCNFNGALIRLAGGNYWILHECIFDSIKWSRKGQKRAATKIKSWRAAKDAVIELGPTFSAMTMVSPSKSP